MKNTRIVRILLVVVLVCALVFCFVGGMRIHEERGGIHPIETVTSEFARVIYGAPSDTPASAVDSSADNQGAMEEDAVGALAEGEVA